MQESRIDEYTRNKADDFATRAHALFVANRWTWCDGSVPSRIEVRAMMDSLVETCQRACEARQLKHTYASSGRIVVTLSRSECSDDVSFSLRIN